MNKYNFDFAMSATITPAVVQEMIKQVVEEQTQRKVARIEVNLRSVSTGYMRDERLETIFDGVTVYFQSTSA